MSWARAGAVRPRKFPDRVRRLANMTSDSADLRPAPKTHGALEGQGARKRDTWAMGMGPGKEGTRGDNVLVNGGMAAGHGDQTQAAEIYSGAQ